MANQEQHRPPGVRVIRKPEVLAKVCMSKSQMYRLILAGEFPKPYKLSERVTVWSEAEIDAWLAAKLAG